MKRIFALVVALVLVVASLLSGCNSDKNVVNSAILGPMHFQIQFRINFLVSTEKAW